MTQSRAYIEIHREYLRDILQIPKHIETIAWRVDDRSGNLLLYIVGSSLPKSEVGEVLPKIQGTSHIEYDSVTGKSWHTVEWKDENGNPI